MAASVRSPDSRGPWTSLWVVALLSLLGQLALCQFFSFGASVPVSIDVDPSNLWKYAYQFPPNGEFLVLNWFGIPNLPPSLNPFSLAAHLPAWLFFTAYAPVIGTLALLAMAAFLRELELPRPAALFGGVVFAWQGDILPFVFPGHYAYIATWPFYALAAWGALRSQRTGQWPYALISGASCGLMVALQPDRGGIASLLIAALYLASALGKRAPWSVSLRMLTLCAATALLISFASLLALFQSFIVGVSMGGEVNREETYKFDTQFSYGPEETLTYLVPGFFGWHSSSAEGPYWGRIGQWPGWEKKHEGMRNLNLAISTTGTVAAVLALLGIVPLLLGVAGGWLGPARISERQRFYGRVLLALGAIALVLAWGYHTPLYRALFVLPLMDKWRNPLKWLEMTNFALVTLGAFGVQHLFGSLGPEENEETRSLRRRLRWFVDGTFLLLLLAFAASYPFTTQLAARLPAEDYDAVSVANIMSTVHISLLVAAVLMALVAVLLRLIWKPDRLRAWKLVNPWLHRGWQNLLTPDHLPLALALGLAVLSAVQLAWVATKFIRPTDLSILTQSNPLVEALASQGNTVRVSVAAEDPVLNVLMQNQLSTPLISCLEISAASRIPDALDAFLGNFVDDRMRLWFLAGVKNLAIPQGEFDQLQREPHIMANIQHVDGYMLEPTSSPNLPSHALVQLKDYLAKATFVPNAEILTPAAQLGRMKDPNWNPRDSVLLSAPAPPAAETLPSAPLPLNVDLGAYTSQRIDLTVQAPQAGYLLINDQFDPDWQVQVNGRDTPMVQADYLLRAIPVSAGSSTVTMLYQAHYHLGRLNLRAETVNLFCDAALLAAWLIAGIALWRQRNGQAALSNSTAHVSSFR
jgi:hypothetical protein